MLAPLAHHQPVVGAGRQVEHDAAAGVLALWLLRRPAQLEICEAPLLQGPPRKLKLGAEDEEARSPLGERLA